MVGIGGSGMCGIAEVLLNLGFTVSGSDLQLSEVTERLARLGATICEGHSADNLKETDVVVFSSAVRPENVEVRRGRELHIPTIPRSEMLAELMRLKRGIAVAGTHGKTTVTSMIGSILQYAELNPTLIVGGIVRSLESGAQAGTGELLVAEADEFDRSFLRLSPTLAVITTIEAEHLDTYTDVEDIKDAFVEFANNTPFYGSVVACADDRGVQDVLPRIKRQTVTFGLESRSDYRAHDLVHQEGRVTFRVSGPEIKAEQASLNVPGEHNVLNALAAIAVCAELDVPFATTKSALERFSGVRRRFEIKRRDSDLVVVDDYAHHPTEIRQTLRTARACWPERRIVALFQPHLYSRTRDFADEFANALAEADLALVTEIFGARERPIEGVHSEMIINRLGSGSQTPSLLLTPSDIAAEALSHTKVGDVLVVMGAGSITREADRIAASSRS